LDKHEHNASASFTVGDWTVEPELGRLRSSEVEAALQPQVMELLVYLARHPNELISVDRMIEEVWHGKPMTSGSVYNALNTLRKTFGDRADQPRYIETIPRRGYRLIAEVQWNPSDEPSADRAQPGNFPPGTSVDPANAPSRAPRRAWRTRLPLVMALGLLLVYLGWERGWLGMEPKLQQTPPPEKSIAVLPFVDMSPGSDQTYFAEGIAEEILHLIARHPDLKVVGRSSSFQFRGDGVDLKAVGQQLQVAHVLEGSIRRDGPQLRITAQLISTADGYHVWSDTFESELGDVFRVQDEIASQIAEKLQLAVLGGDAARISASSRAPDDISVHDLYLLARYRVNLGGKENIGEAIDYLEQALELDPDYAPAHVEMAYALHGLSRAEHGSWYPPPDLRQKIVRHAEIAASLDARQSGAYAIRGTLNYIKAFNGHDLPQSAVAADRQFRRALELNPNDARALLWASGLHRLQGRSYREAVALARRSTELEPLMSYAVHYYLRLLSDLPDRNVERWELIEKLGSGALDWEGDADLLRAQHHFLEGQLARAFELTEGPGMDSKPGASGPNWHSWTRMALGAPETISVEFPGPTDADLWFLAGTPMMEILHPDRGIEYCERMGDHCTADLNACAAFGLRIGRYAWTQELLDKALPVNEDDFVLQYAHTFHLPHSAALTQATLARLDGDGDRLAKYLQLIEEVLKSMQGEPPIELRSVMLTRAHVYALKGESVSAIQALNRVVDTGERMFVHFMHPAFEAMRHDPGFIGVHERWMDLINEERKQLGLAPLSPNPDVGPGILPFFIAETGLQTLSKAE
jgi:TolB-like protein/DNA-binding winged helix-turn-helix (wHTH) protein